MTRYCIEGKVRECRGITPGGSRKYGPMRKVCFPPALNGGVNPPSGHFYCNGVRYVISSTYSANLQSVYNLCVATRLDESFWEDPTAYRIVAQVRADGWLQAKQAFTLAYPSIMALYGNGRIAITESK